MKFVIAPDSFKGSFSSIEICNFIEKGIHYVFPDSEIIKCPIADGGEGTKNIITQSLKGNYINIEVIDPLGKKIITNYGVINNKKVIIDLASASGIELIPTNKRNPFTTTTYGTGQIINHALENGYKDFIIGIGGSSTVDGGAGLVQALGIDFIDKNGKVIHEFMNGSNISEVYDISFENLNPNIKKSKFIIASDVENTLLGKNGSVYTFAEQKGAKKSELEILENNMKHFYTIIEKKIGKKIITLKGSGAAGGVGSGLISFLNAEIRSGIDIVLEIIDFENKIKDANYIFTGEGKIDKQTIFGKSISGITKLAKKYNIPVIAICGSIEGDIKELLDNGLTSVFSIYSSSMSESEAIKKSDYLINNQIINVCNLLKLIN